MNRLRVALTASVFASTLAAGPAFAQSEPYLGQIMLVPYTYCPMNWIEANGQQLPISSYTALFALFGTTYGGDGRTRFAVPDLRGRVPQGVSTDFAMGQTVGLAAAPLKEKQPAALTLRYCIATTGIFPSRP